MSRSRTQLLLIAIVVLSVLLGVVAFVSRGHSEPSGSGAQSRGASQALANTMFTIWFVVMAVGAVGLIFALAQGRRFQQQRIKRSNRIIRTMVLLALPVLLVLGAAHFHAFRHGSQPGNAKGLSKLTSAQEELKKERHAAIHQPTFQWPLAAGIIALAVGGTLTALLRAKARRNKLADDVGVIVEIRRVLDDTLDDLRNEADPRKAVIAAYARMERVLGASGFPRRPSEAPQEYLERVLVDLHVTKPAVERLTELFTRAKFSQHAVDPQMKDDAIDALVALREQMRTIAAAEDKPELRLSDVPGTVQ